MAAYPLITYLPIKYFNKNKIYYYHGIIDKNTHKLINKNYKNIIINKKLFKKKEKIKKFKYCERVYKKIFDDLIINLNKIHKAKHSQKYWKIVIGRYLKDLIYLIYKNFIEIERLLNNKISKIYTLPVNKYELICDSYLTLIFNFNLSEWNSKLSTKIIKFLNNENNINYISNKKIRTNHLKLNNNGTFSNSIKKCIFYILNKFSINNSIFFYESGLDFFSEKKIEHKLKQLSSAWRFPTLKIKSKINNKLRGEINFKFTTNNNFEKFLKKNLISFLPLFIIEEFKDLNNEVANMHLPKKLRQIITGTGFTNEYFNLYTASHFSKGAKYSVIQHGNGYHTDIPNNFLFEDSDTIDRIYTWGPKEKKNQIPLFNTRVINKKKFVNNFKKNGYLTIVCHKLASRPFPFEVFWNNEKKFLDTLELVLSLPDYIKKKVIFRLSPDNTNGNNQILKNYLIKSNLPFFDENISFKKICKKTSFFLFSYDSTGFYDNLHKNIPTICYDDNDMRYDKAEDTYKKLMNESIFLKNKFLIREHLIKVWDNPLAWWNSKKTRFAIKQFNKKYNKIPVNPINKFAKLILT